MTRQLSLIETPPAWRLDERTRQTGRQGVADARAALRAALAAASDGDAPDADHGDRHARSAA